MKKAHKTNARNALRKTITPGSRVFFSMAAAQPQTLLNALVDDYDFYRDVEIVNIYLFADHPLAKPGMRSSFHCVSLQNSPTMSQNWDEGRIDFLPIHYSSIPAVFSDSGTSPIDVALVQVSPPDRKGNFSLGASTCLTYPLAKGAKQIIAEVNEQAPRTCGPCYLREDEIDYIVETSHPLIPFPDIKTGEEEKRIATNAIELIPDGATIQIGVGKLPVAILRFLEGKKDLGVHSGMISDEFVDLFAKGVITNRKKNLYQGKLITGELFGSEKLFSFAHENPSIEMHPVGVTHNATLIGTIDNFIAINSTISVALDGQMNGEFLNGTQIGGIGGLFDFFQGAFVGGGKSITVLNSTASRGKVSRIVSTFERGTPITIPRYLSDIVVTEFGIAELRDKNLRERAEALIAIAHPDFRDRLWEESMRDKKILE